MYIKHIFREANMLVRYVFIQKHNFLKKKWRISSWNIKHIFREANTLARYVFIYILVFGLVIFLWIFYLSSNLTCIYIVKVFNVHDRKRWVGLKFWSYFFSVVTDDLCCEGEAFALYFCKASCCCLSLILDWL